MDCTSGEAKTRDLTWLFCGRSGPSREDVRKWWQQRRLRYNRDLFFIGVVTWILVAVAGSAAVKPGDDFEEPIMMLVGPFLYAGFANLAYTAGPIFDTLFFRGAPRRKLFKAGYIFSLVLTALPGVWAVMAWLITVVTGQKLG
jgi:hypothetical protein